MTNRIRIRKSFGHLAGARDTFEIPDDLLELIESCARGSYQRALLAGGENWSGSSLKGKASSWGATYARSRGGLYSRIKACLPDEYSVSEQLVAHRANGQSYWTCQLILERSDGRVAVVGSSR